MNIDNIRPALIKIQFVLPVNTPPLAVPPPEWMKETKPNAYAVRHLLLKHKVTQRCAAELTGVPIIKMKNWLNRRHRSDIPAWGLQRIKTALATRMVKEEQKCG